MTRVAVHKFGGTSVGTPEALNRVVDILRAALDGDLRLVVVSSALAGVTDRLVELGEASVAGRRREADAIVAELRDIHLATLSAVAPGSSSAERAILEHIEDLTELAHALGQLGELSARSRDRLLAIGEKLAVIVLAAALSGAGIEAVPLQADELLETDDHFGEAQPLLEEGARHIRAALSPHLEAGRVAVVTGFCGRAPDGATTTLGRGGSDLSATVLAAALGAVEVTIWTDVDGVATADPRLVPEAQVIPHLNYREAAEMSFYGAKVLHQRSMIPAVARGLAVRTRNTFRPDHPGTLLDGRFTPGSHPVKAITSIRGQALVSVEGKGLSGVPGMAARVFRALADRGISITMISQSSSEASICFAMPADAASTAETALKEELRPELARGQVEEIDVSGHVGLIAAVGLGMAHSPGIAARVFQALGRRRINVLAIAQGSSELNISLAVDEDDVPAGVRTLHEALGLHRLDTGDDSPDRIDLVILGLGQVGRALAGLLMRRSAHIAQRFGLEARLVAVADRSGFLLRPNGIDWDEVETILAAKAGGRSLSELGGEPLASPQQLVEEALRYRLVRPTLVDLSDADASAPAFLAALEAGCDIVTANKKPLASDPELFRQLRDRADRGARLLRAEATVGAGLPVLDTLEMLLASGDRIRRLQGCLSGTLAFLFDQLERGRRFSDAVRLAVEHGYTEPDPAVDLSGWDVWRKATILARWSGLAPDQVPPAPEGLVAEDLIGSSAEGLFNRLVEYDGPIAERIEGVRRQGNVLRYVALVEPGRVRVGPQAVAPDSPLGQLQGTDNMIVIESDHYCDRPLVVRGPGAGVDVTAQGVLADILRIAAERR